MFLNIFAKNMYILVNLNIQNNPDSWISITTSILSIIFQFPDTYYPSLMNQSG